MRLSQVPELDISIIGNGEPAVGCGEPAVTVVAPAIRRPRAVAADYGGSGQGGDEGLISQT